MTAIAAGATCGWGLRIRSSTSQAGWRRRDAELVERVARLGELAGRPVATPKRAREILRLAA
jgi:uncharacterized protein (DUF849 family)